MKGCLRIGFLLVALVAAAIYCAIPHPTHNQAKIQAIAAESQRLMAAYPINLSRGYAEVPKDRWPPAIAGLKPFGVTVYPGTVDIMTKPFFDGGWGYGFAKDKRNLGMLEQSWSELGHGVYWHGPC